MFDRNDALLGVGALAMQPAFAPGDAMFRLVQGKAADQRIATAAIHD